MDRTMKGVAKTIIDGIGDAQKQIDYAKEAKEAGNTQLASLHIEETKKRLQGVSDWRKKLNEMPERGRNTEMEDTLWEYYDDWKEKLMRKVSEWRM